MKEQITIVGAGPSGLFSSYLLLKKGFKVSLYDHSTWPAKKFLIAGKGGLNLTHSEDLETFSSRYGTNKNIFKSLLKEFSPQDLRQFCSDIGIETFIGTSGRIFPKGLNSYQMLSNWLNNLNAHANFNLYLKHSFISIKNKNQKKELTFENSHGIVVVKSNIVIFALGGASYKKTGSDGLWQNIFKELDIKMNAFLPMNCGFETRWSAFFKNKINRSYLKNIELHFKGRSCKGEIMITPFGIEGGAIYALSNFIRDNIIKDGIAKITIDLKPQLSVELITSKLNKREKKTTISNHLRKVLNIDKITFILLKEILADRDFKDNKILANKIKKLEIELVKTRPIDEAISTSGGICFSELNDYLELNSIPNIYFAGEMLDFEAPTGGYLLQGCFSSAFTVVRGICRKKNNII